MKPSDEITLSPRERIIQSAIDAYLKYVDKDRREKVRSALMSQFRNSESKGATPESALNEILSWGGSQLSSETSMDDRAKAMADVHSVAQNQYASLVSGPAYAEYAKNMNDHIVAASESAQRIVNNTATVPGEYRPATAMVTPQQPPSDRNYNRAFSAQQASLKEQVKTDETGIIAARLKQSEEDQKNVSSAIASINSKLEASQNPSMWSGVPRNVANAEKADLTSQLKAEKANVEKFGTTVAGMTPQERQNLDNFFTMVEKEPEKAKSFMNDVKVKEAKIELVEEQIDKIQSSNALTGLPRNVANAEKADLTSQLKAEKAKLEAAPLEHAPNSKPEYVSSLNPTGDIQKQKDLDAFFANVKKQEEQKAANAATVPGEFRPAAAMITPTKQTQPAPRSGGGPAAPLSGGNSPSGTIPAAPKTNVMSRPNSSGGGGGLKYM